MIIPHIYHRKVLNKTPKSIIKILFFKKDKYKTSFYYDKINFIKSKDINITDLELVKLNIFCLRRNILQLYYNTIPI